MVITKHRVFPSILKYLMNSLFPVIYLKFKGRIKAFAAGTDVRGSLFQSCIQIKCLINDAPGWNRMWRGRFIPFATYHSQFFNMFS